MGSEEFQKLLKKNGAYETASGQTHFVADRLFGWSDTWYYLRTFLIVLGAWVTAWCIGFDRKAWASRAYDILRLIEGCDGRISICGLESLAKLEGPAVYVANHMSMVETMLLPGAIILAFQDVTTVVKQSLLRYPFFGKIMRCLNPISVTRRNPMQDFKEVLNNGEKCLRGGQSVLVFPQATRSAEFNPGDFNTLGVKLARRAGVPIVPVALKTDFQGVGRVFRDLGRIDRNKTIYFKFGEPLTVEGNGREAHEKVVRFITDNLREWGVVIR